MNVFVSVCGCLNVDEYHYGHMCVCVLCVWFFPSSSSMPMIVGSAAKVVPASPRTVSVDIKEQLVFLHSPGRSLHFK